MIMNKPQRMIGTDRGDKRCGILPGKAACGMSESAERTPAPPGSVAQAAPAAQPGSAHVQGMRLRRRPTGTPPPLPHPIAVSTTAWVLLAVVIVACAFLFSEITPWRRVGDQANTWVLLRLADVRTPWLTDVANGINAAGNGWGIPVVGVSVVVLIVVFRRWRHLAVFLGSLFFLEEVAGQWIYEGLTRPRPYGVTIIGSWGGYSAPSVPVAALTAFLMGAVFGLVVPGRPRTYAKAIAAVVIAVLGLARLYLAVDHP